MTYVSWAPATAIAPTRIAAPAAERVLTSTTTTAISATTSVAASFAAFALADLNEMNVCTGVKEKKTYLV
jgi:hypothetical protein